MSATATHPLVARFALIIAGLQHVIAASIARQPTTAALIVLAHTRLARLMGRLTSLIARAEAGTLRPPGPRLPSKPRTRKPEKTPRAFGWFSRFGSWQVAAYRSQLEHLLADPEMERLLQSTPQAGRILRPLCHALGIRKLPDPLRLRPAAPVAPPDAQPAVPQPAPRQAEPPNPSLTFARRPIPDP